ncbi:MAG: SRPBCC family protein [Ilumatobacteraceae bacterium]
MDVNAGLSAPCPPAELFGFVDDLARYPDWLDLITRARPEDASPGTWSIDLRARLGPLARSKRLRMVRTVHDTTAHRVRFERRELDDRRHSPWVLEAHVDERDDGSELRMHLHYGGKLWTGGVLERALSDQIEQGRERLLALTRPTH